MADLQSWHFKREIPFKCWWHNTTIRLQGGKKFPKVEKPRGLHLEKILQDNCLYKSWGHVRAMWLVVSTCWFCIENQHLCLGQGRKGACKGGLWSSSPCNPSDSALSHGDLSWGFTEVTGPGFWVAWKNRQIISGTTTFHCLQWWHVSGLSHGNNVSLKYKKINPSPLLFISWKRVTCPQVLQPCGGQLPAPSLKSVSFTYQLSNPHLE